MSTFEPDKYTKKAIANADFASWEWLNISEWEFAAEPWQKFNEQWYGNTANKSCATSLSIEPLLPCLTGNFSATNLVRKCYVEIFNRVWDIAMELDGLKGIIITGQPGSGKSTSQFYMLVQLLQRRQVVLFTLNGERLYLFCFDQVITTSMGSLNKFEPGQQLPTRNVWSSGVFIWSLFDIEKGEEPDMLLVTPPCLPVQTSSPDPIRFRRWACKFTPLRIGMPLWTRDELAQGLPYQARYESLLAALHEDYSGSQGEIDPLLRFPGARELLDEVGTTLSDKDAIDHLLSAAIDRFGYSGRDVFTAVFEYLVITDHHMKAFNTDLEDLKNTASCLWSNEVTARMSHHIIMLSPVYSGPYRNDKWNVNFKSQWVAENVMENLGIADQVKFRRQIVLL